MVAKTETNRTFVGPSLSQANNVPRSVLAMEYDVQNTEEQRDKVSTVHTAQRQA